jgi:hypothetical protein
MHALPNPHQRAPSKPNSLKLKKENVPPLIRSTSISSAFPLSSSDFHLSLTQDIDCTPMEQVGLVHSKPGLSTPINDLNFIYITMLLLLVYPCDHEYGMFSQIPPHLHLNTRRLDSTHHLRMLVVHLIDSLEFQFYRELLVILAMMVM